MAEEKGGQKPEKRYVMGQEKPDLETSEVEGHSKRVLYTCYVDGAGNYWDGSWSGFTCWRCGAHNDI